MKTLMWQADEYVYYRKGTDWYIAVCIIGLSLAAASILLANLLFAIVVVVSVFTLCLYAGKKPKRIACSIDTRGIRMADNLYPYATLESFWVATEHGPMRLLLKSKKTLSPLIVLPLEGVDPQEIREFLSQYLVEEEHAEPLSQKIMEYLGF